MSIGIVGAGNMGRSIATQLGKTGERVVLADRDPAKAEGVVAEIGAGDVGAAGMDDALASVDGQVDEVPLDVFLASDDADAKSQVSALVRAAGLRPIDAGALDNARLLERLTAFQVELNQRYDLGFRLTFKLLPAELPK
jgi:8-hydroxy-5-deazaflavin:NADPH oxidoreductase